MVVMCGGLNWFKGLQYRQFNLLISTLI
jgi:hypothetical protein